MAEPRCALHLWLVAAALDTEVVAWATYPVPAAGISGPEERPYRIGVDALVDGWRLVQAPGPVHPDAVEHDLGYEFVFERLADLD